MGSLYKKKSIYLQMSTDELNSLSDNEFFYAIIVRTEHVVDGYKVWKEGVNALNPYQKLFYSVNRLELEVNNGGLCQFFVNSSRMVAPLVSEYMAIIGADEHKKLYDTFLEKNNIDVNDLSSFDIDDFEEFEEQRQRYSFDEYDEAFYHMEPLETYLVKYVKEHLEEF